MIKAVINDQMKGYSIRTFRNQSVKDIMKLYTHQYGKVGRNTLTTDEQGNEVVRWNFRFANVVLYGDGVRTQFGYRTIK